MKPVRMDRPDPPPDPGLTAHRADPRLPAYLVAGFGAMVVAIATGEHILASLGAPFLVLAALGLPRRPPTRVRGRVELSEARVIEGDPVVGEVHVSWDGEAEVDVFLAGWRGVASVDPAPEVGWSLSATQGSATLPFRFQARAWGVHDLGTVWVRVRRPGGLVIREGELARAPAVRVLPSPHRLDRLLEPEDPRAVAGVHLSRLRGHGTDFAELRPYRPGDRLRDLSWATSARLGEPWVTVHHPERTGTVLLLLDASFSSPRRSGEALARAARAAWAVASTHLEAQDRVGLLAQGRTAAWLPPQGGRRARWLLLDQLLTVGGAAEDIWRRRRLGGRVVVPADALIVGVTALRSRTFARRLLHARRIGHPTAALVIDEEDLLPQGSEEVDTAARRVWVAQREAERHRLERRGVVTALVSPGRGAGPAVSALRRRMRARRRSPGGGWAG